MKAKIKGSKQQKPRAAKSHPAVRLFSKIYPKPTSLLGKRDSSDFHQDLIKITQDLDLQALISFKPLTLRPATLRLSSGSGFPVTQINK
jgi:hypothetical protein